MYLKFINMQYKWTRQMQGVSDISAELQADAKKVLLRTLKWLDTQPGSFLHYQRSTQLILRNNRRTVAKIRVFIFDLALNTQLGPDHLELILREVLYIKRNGWAYYQRVKNRPYSN